MEGLRNNGSSPRVRGTLFLYFVDLREDFCD